MKNLVLLCLFLIPALGGYCQNPNTHQEVYQYVFKEFQKGTILYNSGQRREILLNYNTLTEEMVFQQAGKLMALDNASLVDTIFIDGRKFIPRPQHFLEVIYAGGLPLYIQHKYNLIPPPKRVGYGGTSETSATTSYSSLLIDGSNFYLELPAGYKLKSKTDFFVLRGSSFLKANNTSQVISIYPEKKQQVKQLVKQQKTDFSRPEEVLKPLYALEYTAN